VKPDASSQGKGIYITRKVEEIPKDKCHVVQEYLKNPYLIDGYKFDFRVYVLLVSVAPEMICYLYSDGLGRFATEKYTKDTSGAQEGEDAMFSHLTNYSLNKNNPGADWNKYKKTLREVFLMLEKEGADVSKIYHEIRDIVVKTLISILPQVRHMYKTCSPSQESNPKQCFEILGFDIILDKKLKPWLLEVNHAPSLNDDTETDKKVKTQLLIDTFKLLNIKPSHRHKVMKNEKKGMQNRRPNGKTNYDA